MDYETPEERRARRKAERLSKAQDAQDDLVLQNLMASTAGRAWMRGLLERCHIFHASFSSDALVMAMREGERNIGLIVMAGVMRACPDAYIQMMKEQGDAGSSYHDRRDPDDERNYDDAGRWIGAGDAPDGVDA